MKLSIGRAWDESRQVLARDGRIIALVALALLVIPGTLVGLAAPQPQPDGANGLASFLALASGLIGLAGQIAISRIALGPPLTVGQAIAVGFKRLPSFFVAALLWAAPFIIAAFLILQASGADMSNPSAPVPPNPAAAFTLLFLLIVFIVIAVHMIFTTPAAAATRDGPLGLVRQSWRLSRGRALKLFGLILLVLIVAMVLLLGLGSAINAVILLLLGEARPWNVSALAVALVSQLLAAVISVGLAVLVARLYAQATGGSANAAEPSVPSAGAH